MNEDLIGLFVPIVSMIVLGTVVVSFFYFRYRNRSELQETVRQAIDKGNDLTPELVDRLAGPKQGPEADLRRAVVWLAVGIGFVLFGVILNEPDAVQPLTAVGMFPILIGIAYLIMWKFTNRNV